MVPVQYLIVDGFLMREQDLRRYWAKVDKSAGSLGCWPWKARISWDGYGQFSLHGRKTRSHRISFTAANGQIPEGHVPDHLCTNTWCQNPLHMEAVTLSENTRRNFERKRECNHGHELKLGNIYTQHNSDGSFRRCCLTCRRESLKRVAERARRRKNIPARAFTARPYSEAG
jgi:hypothetical protein